MANNIQECLHKLSEMNGFVGAAIANSDSGMALGKFTDSTFNLDVAAAANAEVIKSKRRAIQMLKLKESLEDILITLDTQYHLIRPSRQRPHIFFYVVLDKSRANLALARMTLEEVEAELQV